MFLSKSNGKRFSEALPRIVPTALLLQSKYIEFTVNPYNACSYYLIALAG
jgi:hypothetical protein